MIDKDCFFSKKIIPYQKRHIFFKSWCESKKVLAVGCVDHDYQAKSIISKSSQIKRLNK